MTREEWAHSAASVVARLEACFWAVVRDCVSTQTSYSPRCRLPAPCQPVVSKPATAGDPGRGEGWFDEMRDRVELVADPDPLGPPTR